MIKWLKREKDETGTPPSGNGGRFAKKKQNEAGYRPLVSPVREVTHANLSEIMLDERIPAEQWMAIVKHDDYLIRENAVAFASEGYFDNMMAWEAVDHLLQHEQNPIVLSALTRSNLPTRDWVIDEYRKGRVTSVDVAKSPVIAHEDYRAVIEGLTKEQATTHSRDIFANPLATDEDRLWLLENKIDPEHERAGWAHSIAVDAAKSPEALDRIAGLIDVTDPNSAWKYERAIEQIPKNRNVTPEILDRIAPSTGAIRAALVHNRQTPKSALERVLAKEIEVLDDMERRVDFADADSASEYKHRTGVGRAVLERVMRHPNATPEMTEALRTNPNPVVAQEAIRIAHERARWGS